MTTVTSTDIDVPANTLGYSIAGGADAAMFAIDAVSGALTFRAPPNFEVRADANADGVYDVLVQVTDGAGGVDTQLISVTVTDVNDAPVITSNGGAATAAVNLAENIAQATTNAATDEDLPA